MISLKFSSLYIFQYRKQCLSCSWNLTKSSSINVILNDLLYLSPTSILKKSWTHFSYPSFYKCYCYDYIQGVNESPPLVNYFSECSVRKAYKGHDTLIVSGNYDNPCRNIHCLRPLFIMTTQNKISSPSLYIVRQRIILISGHHCENHHQKHNVNCRHEVNWN